MITNLGLESETTKNHKYVPMLARHVASQNQNVDCEISNHLVTFQLGLTPQKRASGRICVF